jgi:hypothetical protein
MIQPRVRGELWLSSPEGLQHGDVCRPYCDYVTTRGDPGVSDPTNEAAADHRTNTLP